MERDVEPRVAQQRVERGLRHELDERVNDVRLEYRPVRRAVREQVAERAEPVVPRHVVVDAQQRHQRRQCALVQDVLARDRVERKVEQRARALARQLLVLAFRDELADRAQRAL